MTGSNSSPAVPTSEILFHLWVDILIVNDLQLLALYHFRNYTRGDMSFHNTDCDLILPNLHHIVERGVDIYLVVLLQQSCPASLRIMVYVDELLSNQFLGHLKSFLGHF